jgi:hypothetical protein
LKEVRTLIRFTYENKFKNIRYNDKSNNNLVSRYKLKSIRIVMIYWKLDRKIKHGDKLRVFEIVVKVLFKIVLCLKIY